jgi:hypothetical protein
MRKLARITALAGVALIVLGSALFAFYVFAGQSLTSEGFLVEEFAAGALGVMAVLLGLLVTGVAGIMALVARRKH